MPQFRNLSLAEITALETLGSTARNWSEVCVTDDFRPEQIVQSHFSGRVEIASGATIIRSHIRNYRIGENTYIAGVTSLECRQRSAFGNGVKVATINENEGRSIPIFEGLSSQIAYTMAVYRHRAKFLAAMERIIANYTEARTSDMGSIGKDSRIVGVRFIRETRIGEHVIIDGASMLENGTLCDNTRIGIDVKAYNFIVAEGAHIDNGSILRNCFVGESCHIDNGFTAAESLFFANSQCENGEAASIFAGPYTVSHHKSSLLIAGMFSFFNAGSGSNQSNHLFKSGAVHQAVHLRGCKFASGAYIMSPALEGAFTMIMGHHTYHHDTSIFPYSYLIEKEGRTFLMPGANLASYGSVRDIEKWPARDRRTIQRDVINFEEYNPYVAQAMIRAIDMLHTLQDDDPDAQSYIYRKAVIRATSLRRGISLYNKYLVAALGYMLDRGESDAHYVSNGRWVDVAGQYITKQAVDAILDAVECGDLTTPQQIDNRFRVFMMHYDDYAHSWALQIYASLLDRTPTVADLNNAIVAGHNAHDSLRRMTDADREKDFSLEMAVSYGLDSEDNDNERRDDYFSVRGIK